MGIAIDILIVAFAILGLWKGAVWLVDGAARTAKRLGVSELVIGLTVVALGTSAPEFAVTITAALSGRADISVGNVVGSNIFNLGFILGGVALVRAIVIPKRLVWREGSILIGTALLLLAFLHDLCLAQWEGIVLMAALAGYIGMLMHFREASDEELPAGDMRWYDVPKMLLGLAAVAAGGHFLVEAASSLARTAGVSEWVIGVTIVAAGTSVPEMATCLVAVLRGRYGISVGNLIGSDIFNLLGVLGVAAVVSPNPMIIDAHGYSSLLGLLGLMVLVIIMMRTGWLVSRKEGAMLVLINAARWAADFILG